MGGEEQWLYDSSRLKIKEVARTMGVNVLMNAARQRWQLPVQLVRFRSPSNCG